MRVDTKSAKTIWRQRSTILGVAVVLSLVIDVWFGFVFGWQELMTQAPYASLLIALVIAIFAASIINAVRAALDADAIDKN